MAKTKQLSSKPWSGAMPTPPKGKMNTSQAPKGKGASVPNWSNAAKVKTGFLKAKKA